ncbi:hypothetical protein [Methylocystis hirsuta]|uniref:Uncharacterized protein n=1 Tax=Methylocystis hirsuta TaxID=369798 RepID=A0A3M9XQI9_9HYPH|nr:hypothetical protein [Methylocystis hirsuta]RNJ50115.1 hypothetical protein D1O30_11430 [Methylocystis hirsuta]
MDATLSAAAAFIGAPNAQFLALTLIGCVIGWCATKLSHVMHSNIAAGALLLSAVTGGWLAAELAVRAGVGPRGADAVLVAGAIGAALFCAGCRALHHAEGSHADIAVRG